MDAMRIQGLLKTSSAALAIRHHYQEVFPGHSWDKNECNWGLNQDSNLLGLVLTVAENLNRFQGHYLEALGNTSVFGLPLLRYMKSVGMMQ